MAKFYVQCGPIETILIADSAEQAAMAAIDHSLQAHLWIYDDPQLNEADCREHLMLEALLHLAPSVRVSERGFNRRDAIEFGTPESVISWHKLMVGMRKLFVAAGLTNRSMASVAGSSFGTAATCPAKPR